MQNCSNSSAHALGLLQSCTKPSISSTSLNQIRTLILCHLFHGQGITLSKHYDSFITCQIKFQCWIKGRWQSHVSLAQFKWVCANVMPLNFSCTAVKSFLYYPSNLLFMTIQSQWHNVNAIVFLRFSTYKSCLVVYFLFVCFINSFHHHGMLPTVDFVTHHILHKLYPTDAGNPQ